MRIKSYIDFINEELQRVVSDQSGSGRTKSLDTIWDDPVSSKSPSSGILLRQQLKDREFNDLRRAISSDVPDYVIKNMIKGGDAKLNKFKVTLNNLQFLKDKAKEGELRCEYCDKGPLVIYDFNPDELTPENIDKPGYRFNTKFSDEDGATCDHKQPQSKGGDKFDYSNLAVCCRPCNKKKSNMSWEEWKKLMKITENLSNIEDEQEIKDIFSDLEDHGFDILVIPPYNNKKILVQIKGYLPKSNAINTLEVFSKDLSDIVKRLEHLYSKIELNTYSIDDIAYDGDGERIELGDRLKIWINIYVSI